jgi:hypothetical protein
MTAANLVFDTEKDTLSAGPVLWIGKADLQQQDSAKTWELSADETDWPGDGTSVWIHGRATDGEVIVLADKIVHDQETDVLTAEGNVKFFGEDVNLSCPKAVVDRKNQKAVLSGTVEMLIKPEEKKGLKEEEIPPLIPYVPEEVKANRPLPPKSDPERELDDQVRSGESIREYPVSIIAKQIEYWYKEGDRKAFITGSPQARQEMTGGRWRMIWAHHAEYDGEKDWLKLLSRKEERDARFKNSVGDDFKAFHFELSTKKDDDRMSGKGVQGVAQVREEDETGGGTGGGAGGGSGLSGRIGA